VYHKRKRSSGNLGTLLEGYLDVLKTGLVGTGKGLSKRKKNGKQRLWGFGKTKGEQKRGEPEN